ncbi:hypothetical protein H8D30_00210 [bacterium]|nr:hypothetical protein [bacterium]
MHRITQRSVALWALFFLAVICSGYGALAQWLSLLDSQKEAEAKIQLRLIQVALERFATDNRGEYPSYIHGGDLPSWSCRLDPNCQYPKQLFPDPLLRQGYLDTYPSNPFLKRQKAAFWLWSWEVGAIPPTPCVQTGFDPRWGCLSPKGEGDPGREGVVMGNALSDPHVPGKDTDPSGGSLSPLGLPYYFLGDGNPATDDWIPGSFIYRAFLGELSLGRFSTMRTGLDTYVLGVYGGVGTEGTDRLHCLDRDAGFEPWKGNCFPNGFDSFALWEGEPNRPQVISKKEDLEVGFPQVVLATSPAYSQTGMINVLKGNPDGYPDGIILWLLPGIPEAIPPPLR